MCLVENGGGFGFAIKPDSAHEGMRRRSGVMALRLKRNVAAYPCRRYGLEKHQNKVFPTAFFCK